MPATANLRSRLERALRERVKGEVRFDPVARSLYATDASPYLIEPHGVVFPTGVDDLRAVLRVAAAVGSAVLPRGATTVERPEEDGCLVGSAPGLVHGGCHGSGDKAVCATQPNRR